jgi:hypothetical protein
MAVTLNASTSSGFIQTADTSGELNLQSNGTTRLTVTSTGTTITGTQSVSGNLSFNSGYGSSAVAYGCRAWVNFNGSGGASIRASGNVSSVTYNGSGDYTVNFTNAMPDANYSTVTTSDGNLGANQSIAAGIYNGGTYSTSAVRILVFLNGTGGFDRGVVCVSIFR